MGKLKQIISIIQTHGKDINRDLILNKWIRPFSIWALKHNDILIALCNYHKERIQEYVKKEVFILAHGQLPIDLKITREQAIKELKINTNYFNLLFVGRLISSKGADLLLKAAQAISDCFVHIIGDGPEKNNLQKLVKEYGMEDRVLFHNVLSREETLKYMKACDLFVFPTHKEAFGLVILEAMEMKLPIICSNTWDTGGPKDILENEVDALLVPRDYYSFRKGIIRLKNNREMAIKLAENAFLKVKHYTWERVSYKYLDIIRCVIERKI